MCGRVGHKPTPLPFPAQRVILIQPSDCQVEMFYFDPAMGPQPLADPTVLVGCFPKRQGSGGRNGPLGAPARQGGAFGAPGTALASKGTDPFIPPMPDLLAEVTAAARAYYAQANALPFTATDFLSWLDELPAVQRAGLLARGLAGSRAEPRCATALRAGATPCAHSWPAPIGGRLRAVGRPRRVQRRPAAAQHCPVRAPRGPGVG